MSTREEPYNTCDRCGIADEFVGWDGDFATHYATTDYCFYALCRVRDALRMENERLRAENEQTKGIMSALIRANPAQALEVLAMLEEARNERLDAAMRQERAP